MLSALQAALATLAERQGGDDGLVPTGIKGLSIMRAQRPVGPVHVVYRPTLCLVAQGAKQIAVGDRVYDYGEMQSLIVSVDLPVVGRITRASRKNPYLALSMELDLDLLRETIEQTEDQSGSAGPCAESVSIDRVDEALVECVLRLIRLLDRPTTIGFIRPLIEREIYYWLLCSAHAESLRAMVRPDGYAHQIAMAISVLRSGFADKVRVDDLALSVGMSLSSFHRHFRAVTGMPPLQYQKTLRLLEARRLLDSERMTASNAAYRVGYESPTQFSREFTRMFGAPPRRSATVKK